jgi:hypothetical protein
MPIAAKEEERTGPGFLNRAAKKNGHIDFPAVAPFGPRRHWYPVYLRPRAGQDERLRNRRQAAARRIDQPSGNP